MGVVIVEVMRYAVVTQAWIESPCRSSAIVRIEVLTMVWSSAPRNIPSISPDRMARTWACVYSPVSSGDRVWLVAISNESRDHRPPTPHSLGCRHERSDPGPLLLDGLGAGVRAARAGPHVGTAPPCSRGRAGRRTAHRGRARRRAPRRGGRPPRRRAVRLARP